jgi:hypothetical protein
MLSADGVFDDEAVYVALLLHDLGLTAAYRLKPGEGECFTIPGAHAAFKIAREHKWPDRRAYLAAEAITLHLNVTVARRHGPEAMLVRLGSGADVAGLEIQRIPEAQRKRVLDRYPRLDISHSIDQDLRVEANAHRTCRIAWLYRNVGFGRLVKHNCFSVKA